MALGLNPGAGLELGIWHENDKVGIRDGCKHSTP